VVDSEQNGERETDLEGNAGGGQHGHEKKRESVLTADEAGIEVSQAGDHDPF
jgi:hypothetical protein